MRLIDADSLKKSIRVDYTHNPTLRCEMNENVYKKILDRIDIQPTVDQWILCSERLPKEHEETRDRYDSYTLAVIDTKYYMTSDLVNVTVKDLDREEVFVCDDCTVDGKWANFDSEIFKVIAWKPLPQPCD